MAPKLVFIIMTIGLTLFKILSRAGNPTSSPDLNLIVLSTMKSLHQIQPSHLHQLSCYATTTCWQLGLISTLCHTTIADDDLSHLTARSLLYNPDRIKYPCGVCTKPTYSNERAICCDECSQWMHAKCIYMSCESY